MWPIGLVVHLNYKGSPCISPVRPEFQRVKQLSLDLAEYLKGASRIAYGARALVEGGLTSRCEAVLSRRPGRRLAPGAFVNLPRIKGSHNAIKSGMMAAEAAFAAIGAGRAHDELVEYEAAYKRSWVHKELRQVRNVKPLLSRFGTALSVLLGGLKMWVTLLLGGVSVLGDLSTARPMPKRRVWPRISPRSSIPSRTA